MVDIVRTPARALCIQPISVEGRLAIDVRVFVAGDTPNELIPTNEGVTFDEDMLPDVVEELTDLQAALAARSPQDEPEGDG